MSPEVREAGPGVHEPHRGLDAVIFVAVITAGPLMVAAHLGEARLLTSATRGVLLDGYLEILRVLALVVGVSAFAVRARLSSVDPTAYPRLRRLESLVSGALALAFLGAAATPLIGSGFAVVGVLTLCGLSLISVEAAVRWARRSSPPVASLAEPWWAVAVVGVCTTLPTVAASPTVALFGTIEWVGVLFPLGVALAAELLAAEGSPGRRARTANVVAVLMVGLGMFTRMLIRASADHAVETFAADAILLLAWVVPAIGWALFGATKGLRGARLEPVGVAAAVGLIILAKSILPDPIHPGEPDWLWINRFIAHGDQLAAAVLLLTTVHLCTERPLDRFSRRAVAGLTMLLVTMVVLRVYARWASSREVFHLQDLSGEGQQERWIAFAVGMTAAYVVSVALGLRTLGRRRSM